MAICAGDEHRADAVAQQGGEDGAEGDVHSMSPGFFLARLLVLQVGGGMQSPDAPRRIQAADERRDDGERRPRIT